ncbi:MAG TPA: SpoIIE family protein phosphatase [Solirubrobacteraceae bacterium]|nr:SpoIIE family protein phosphatase [Solirubrobacteraceae bacterium]
MGPAEVRRGGGRAAAAAGVAVVVAIAALDTLLGSDVRLVALLVAGPLVAAGWAGTGAVAAIGALALVVAVLLGIPNDNLGATNHVVTCAAVALGALLATLGAGARERSEDAAARAARLLERERGARRHSEFAASVGGLTELPLDPDVRLQRLVELAVPAMADICVIDLLRDDGRLEAVAIDAAGDEPAQELARQRRLHPVDPASDHPVAEALRSGRTQLLADISEQRLADLARDDEHMTALRRMAYATAIVVPLVVEGRTIGTYSLTRCGPDADPYDAQDAAVAEDVARRASLAILAARLYRELAAAERRLDGILRHLAEAVVVRDAARRVVFANDAAARLLGVASPEAIAGRRFDAQLEERYLVLDENGAPLDLEPALTRALASEQPALLRLVDRRTGETRWIVLKVARVLGDGADEGLAVKILEDVTEVQRAERAQRFLSRASALVSSSLDVAATLDKVAWAVVPEVADWCRVDVPDDRGVLHQVALAHPDASRREALAALDVDFPARDGEQAGPAAVLRHGRGQLFAVERDRAAGEPGGDGLDALRAAGTRSVLVVPMAVGDRITGTITMGTDESRRRLDEGDLALAEELGRRAGIALENARVHAARSHIAMTLQRSLLPPRLPIVPGLSIAARFRAAGETTEVGGDFYDLFPAGDAWMVVIGDVTGKGPEAAAITSLARYTMRTASAYERSPARILDRLNRTLAVDPDRRQICTAACLRLDGRDDGAIDVTLSCGGHPPPLLVRPGAPVEPAGRPGPLLGAFDEGRWSESRLRLAAGEGLVLFTDGVTDARGADERFGQDRLAAAVAEAAAGGLDADALAAHVDEVLQAFEVGPQRDDVALLVLCAAGAQAGGEAAILGSAPEAVRSLREDRVADG